MGGASGGEDTLLVSVQTTSNEIGTLQPLEQLAEALRIQTPIVTHWCNGQLDPTDEITTSIIAALRMLNPAVADEFVSVFLDLASLPTTPAPSVVLAR